MPDPHPRQLLARITRFVTRPWSVPPDRGADEAFDALARDAYAFQYGRIEPVRALARARGVTPDDVQSWRDVPAVPALAYKYLDLRPTRGEESPEETFRSSGTTGGEAGARSVHRHRFPGLYRTVVDASFPRFCLPGGEGDRAARVPMLSLIPSRREAPDSSLAFMIDHAITQWGSAAASAYALGRSGVDAKVAAAWCRGVKRDGRPALVLATAFALAVWLDRLAEDGVRFRLPPGSVLFETGGFKGRTREISRTDLLLRVEDRLGVPPERVVREYGMTELTSQLYTATLHGGDPDLFVAPPWVRIRVLDPESLLSLIHI